MPSVAGGRLLLPFLFAALILGTGALSAGAADQPAGEKQAAPAGPPPPVVTVAEPLRKRIIVWDEYTGRFEATERVEVRPRVTGYVDKVHFEDGAIVAKGDLLFSIDQRPFRLAAEAARADIARARAQVKLADTEVDRATALSRDQVITARDADQRRANLAVARADLQAAEARLKQAELDLEWTEVRAPVGGRISDSKIDAGNLVTGGSQGNSLLAVIVSQDPIQFVFDASEADYIKYSRLNRNGGRPSSREVDNPVRVRLSDETTWNRTGRMVFVDNEVNPRSGTIRGRAELANPEGFLTPGVFGRMQLYGGEIDALLIPDASIVSDQAAKIVMVVGPDNTVAAKPVQLGPMHEGLRVVKSGLTAEDRVVIGGLANPFVRPGVPVNPQPGRIEAKPVPQGSAQAVGP